MCGISNGVWIDAGCGRGTYTLPLATLVSLVIAIDNDPYNISFLKTQLPEKTNIIVSNKDFMEDLLYHDLADGILFGFSLHYGPTTIKALQNAFNHLKSGGYIIIFEYSREDPLPWVPFPIPPKKLIPELIKTGFQAIDTIFHNNRYYILKGEKVSPIT